MKKDVLFAVAMAALLQVSTCELDEAYSAFVKDFKSEEGRV